MRRGFDVIVITFTFIFLSGCVTSVEFDSLRSDVNQLKREAYEQRKESSELRRDVNELKEKTAHTIKEDSLQALRESQAAIQSRLSEVSRDVQVLTGRFDENRYSLEKALKDSSTELELLKAQITRIESQTKEIREKLNALEGQRVQQKETAKEQPPSQHQVAQPPKPAEPKDKLAMYEVAYDAFKKKRYKESREKFEAFIKEFPQDELTDNAQFWFAETYYGERDFESAILAYETLLKKYPKSEKAPNALLKQGFSFVEIGDTKTGKTILEKLRERYPNSKEAELAKKKIEEIEKGTKKKKK
jgi:tol-pal system protein YbgF